MLYQLVKYGNPFNWLDLLAHQLKTNVTNTQNLPKDKKVRFYMSHT